MIYHEAMIIPNALQYQHFKRNRISLYNTSRYNKNELFRPCLPSNPILSIPKANQIRTHCFPPERPILSIDGAKYVKENPVGTFEARKNATFRQPEHLITTCVDYSPFVIQSHRFLASFGYRGGIPDGHLDLHLDNWHQAFPHSSVR